VVKPKLVTNKAPAPLKLDLGAGDGRNTPEGYVAVDIVKGKDVVRADLTMKWPWATNSVDEARCIYVLHYLTPVQRTFFVNELYRVLRPEGKCEVHVPHWAAARAYGDPRVQWPPVAEWWFPLLSKDFRAQQVNVDDIGFTCNFSAGIGYGMHQALLSRNSEYQQNAMTWYKEAAQDLIVTLIALK
jgi:SAM-dependent methyltransferase